MRLTLVGPDLSPKTIFSKNITLADNLTSSLHGKNFSFFFRVLYAVALHKKYTRVLTFQNLFLHQSRTTKPFAARALRSRFNFSKVIVILRSKYTRALTLRNVFFASSSPSNPGLALMGATGFARCKALPPPRQDI
jgi:hypothetical protein